MIDMGAKTLFSHSMRIAWKDLTELFRNRLGLVLLIVMPLFMMVMVGFIYPSNGGTGANLPVGIVNEDSGFNGSMLPSQTFIMGLQVMNNQTHFLAFLPSVEIDILRKQEAATTGRRETPCHRTQSSHNRRALGTKTLALPSGFSIKPSSPQW